MPTNAQQTDQSMDIGGDKAVGVFVKRCAALTRACKHYVTASHSPASSSKDSTNDITQRAVRRLTQSMAFVILLLLGCTFGLCERAAPLAWARARLMRAGRCGESRVL
jgi:hypothetical protein